MRKWQKAQEGALEKVDWAGSQEDAQRAHGEVWAAGPHGAVSHISACLLEHQLYDNQ